MKRIAVVAMLCSLLACDVNHPDAQGKAKASEESESEALKAQRMYYQRFVSVSPSAGAPVPWAGALALDTMTGELCKTYAWSIPQRNEQDKTLNSLLLCENLFFITPRTIRRMNESFSGDAGNQAK